MTEDQKVMWMTSYLIALFKAPIPDDQLLNRDARQRAPITVTKFANDVANHSVDLFDEANKPLEEAT